MADQEYLEPGFDPSSLTVPKLRSLLVQHSINYPSSAKKGELIDLFNQHIAPQAKKIKQASLRVKRTSRGIENIPASQSTADEEEELPPPPSTGRRSTGRGARARTEEAEEVPPTTSRSTRHSTAPPEATPRRASSKHARTVEAVQEEPEPKRPASRRSRPSAQTPGLKSEPDDEGSPFSSENVFQTGSSPPPPSTERKRTSMSVVKDSDRRKSDKVVRQSRDGRVVKQQTDGAVVPTRRTFEMPVSAMKKEPVEPTEEFTPEEAQDLALAQQSGELVPVRPRSSAPAKAAKNGVSAVLLALLAASAYLWGDEKFKVGYCGHGEPSREIAGVEIPDWADQYRPSCAPCPPHAICFDKLQTACEPGFVLTNNPLSLNGLLPFPPTCEPDTAMTKKVNAVKERVVEELREQNAKYECGDAPSPEVKETALKKEISSKRKKGMSNQEFEELWDAAIGEVRMADEISQGSDGSGEPTLRSASLRNLSLSCSIRRSLRQTLREYFWALVGIALASGGALYTQYEIRFRRDTESAAKQITAQVYQLLSSQATLHAADPGMYRENYVPMAQLRDDVLRDEYSTYRRKKIWERVQRKVERNSNVRPMVKEGRSGDVGRVWEWVGAVGRIESPPSTGGLQKRKSGRVSFGGEQWIPPSPRGEEGSEMSEVNSSRWREGGQYF